MATKTEILPITETVTPADQAELAEVVRRAYADETPIYPVGGGVSPRFGLPGARPGIALSLAGLNRVVDYPARDMTITVEAGVTMADLASELASQGQRLPIDVPQAGRATLGGVIATNFSGARRHGAGTMRDYVIGISAVDGRGVPFHGGGRVVKNVAGYDFCKLLIGSLGTLAVVTQVTLKVKPRPDAAAFLYCSVADLDEAERLLADMVGSKVTPSAVELLAGPLWREDPVLGDAAQEDAAVLLVGLEGAEDEVRWMAEQLEGQWQSQGARAHRVESEQIEALWARLAEFPEGDDKAQVIKGNMRPSGVTAFVGRLRSVDAGCSIQAHAGVGVVIAKFSGLSPGDFSKALIRDLQPTARAADGNVVVLAYPDGAELTRTTIWGAASQATPIMRTVKRQFDPRGLLNPGRFVYD